MSRTIAFIPCRSGSRRIPHKNHQEVGGVSLIVRAINAAEEAGIPRESIVISTDDPQTRRLAGVFWETQAHFAGPPCHTDTAQIEDAIEHWLRTADVADDDVIALLQPTSWARRPETIRKCVELVRAGCDSALTVTLYPQNTGRVRGLYDEKSGTDVALRTLWDRPVDAPRPRSQDARRKAREAGSVYAFTVGHFRRTRNRMGGREASVPISELEAHEIDTVRDLEIARLLAPHVDRLLAMEGT